MRITRTLIAASALIFTQMLPAQQNNAGPIIYGSSVSYHVPEETRVAYVAWIKDKYRKYAEAMLQEDQTIQSITATGVTYGGVIEPEANFYVTMFQEGYPKSRTELQNKVCQKLFGKSYADFTKEAQPLRKRLGQTLSRRMTMVPGVKTEEGDVVRIDYKKITPGRASDYYQMERDYVPLREAQVKAGTMKSWFVYSAVLPALGTEREYDAFSVHVGKNLEQAMSWGQGTVGIAAQMKPPFNLTGIALRSADIVKTVRVETRVYVMRVAR